MGKHEPMSAKAIANRIKAKGLQKIKYYCEMCKKQCRDDNGFKCHIKSEAHQRQALIVSEDPEKFVSEFSKQFMEGFMYILRTRYKSKRILANTIFQEYIKERDHIHMNGTRWTTLTEFAIWLGENGFVQVEDSERGVMVTYIDKDPETLRRKELEAKKAEQAREAAEKIQRSIELQKEAHEKLLKEKEIVRQQPEPIPIVKISTNDGDEQSDNTCNQSGKDRLEPDNHTPSISNAYRESNPSAVEEKPLFNVQSFSIKKTSSSRYKPPPPKRKLISKKCSDTKKTKTN